MKLVNTPLPQIVRSPAMEANRQAVVALGLAQGPFGYTTNTHLKWLQILDKVGIPHRSGVWVSDAYASELMSTGGIMLGVIPDEVTNRRLAGADDGVVAIPMVAGSTHVGLIPGMPNEPTAPVHSGWRVLTVDPVAMRATMELSRWDGTAVTSSTHTFYAHSLLWLGKGRFGGTIGHSGILGAPFLMLDGPKRWHRDDVFHPDLLALAEPYREGQFGKFEHMEQTFYELRDAFAPAVTEGLGELIAFGVNSTSKVLYQHTSWSNTQPRDNYYRSIFLETGARVKVLKIAVPGRTAFSCLLDSSGESGDVLAATGPSSLSINASLTIFPGEFATTDDLAIWPARRPRFNNEPGGPYAEEDLLSAASGQTANGISPELFDGLVHSTAVKPPRELTTFSAGAYLNRPAEEVENRISLDLISGSALEYMTVGAARQLIGHMLSTPAYYGVGTEGQPALMLNLHNRYAGDNPETFMGWL